MFAYQVRPRVFRLEGHGLPRFPAVCEVCFTFQPLQPFGKEAGGGHTTVRAAAASALFNANNGIHSIESKSPLQPIEVNGNGVRRSLRLHGNVLSIKEQVASLKALAELIEGIYFCIPALLNVEFADPPYVERVDGSIGATRFRWELTEWRGRFFVTTQEMQEEKFAKSWERLELVTESRRLRLLAGLHYFHVACRLARSGATAGEFVAETVLNLSKTLEVIFPPSGDGRTMDAARTGLASLSFSADEIEGNFIPAIALRNNLDVGHVELGVFTMDQLKVIHAFTERAESAFRDMFDRLLARIENNELDIQAHRQGPPRAEALAVIERLRRYTPPDA
jgi:hypothetical protein